MNFIDLPKDYMLTTVNCQSSDLRYSKCKLNNEHILFHGTSAMATINIDNEGLSMKYSRKGKFGKAIYFAGSLTSNPFTRESDCIYVCNVKLGLLGVYHEHTGDTFAIFDDSQCTIKYKLIKTKVLIKGIEPVPSTL